MRPQFLVGVVTHEGFSLLECENGHNGGCGPLTVVLDQYVPEFIVHHLRDVHGETGTLQVIK